MGKKFKKNLIRQNYTSGSKIDVLEPEFYELEPNKYYDVSNVVDWFDVYFIFQDQIIKEGDYSHEFLLNEIYDYYSGNINVPGRNFTLLDVNQDLILSKDYYIELNDDIMKGREYLLDKIDVEQNGEIQVPRTLAQFRDIQSGEIEFRNLLYKIKDYNDAEFVLGKDYYVSSSVIHDFNFGYEYDGYAGFNTNDPNIVLFNDSIILFGDNYDIENNLAYPIQYFEDTHLNGKTNLKI